MSGTTNSYKFTGKAFDSESGLYHFWHRYYDPELGRFTQVDPKWELRSSFSPYNYSINNPLVYIDPDGLLERPVIQNSIISPMGTREDPFSGKISDHKGIDYGVPEGTDVFAVANGLVTLAYSSETYGNVVIISHGNNNHTLYAHNSELLVKPGDSILEGMIIAKSGDSGKSTGAHLHFEIIQTKVSAGRTVEFFSSPRIDPQGVNLGSMTMQDLIESIDQQQIKKEQDVDK